MSFLTVAVPTPADLSYIVLESLEQGRESITVNVSNATENTGGEDLIIGYHGKQRVRQACTRVWQHEKRDSRDWRAIDAWPKLANPAVFLRFVRSSLLGVR